jgi:hypothetical protein
LISALESGYKLKLISGYVFESGYPLASHVKTILKNKTKRGIKEDREKIIIHKNIANILYGKFGIDISEETTIIQRELVSQIKQAITHYEIKNTGISLVTIKMSKTQKQLIKIRRVNIRIARAVSA